MTKLSDLLNDAKDAKGDWSVDRFIADAEKRGVEVNPKSRALVYKALQGRHAKSPEEKTLQLFADVFDLDLRDVRRAANKPAGELGPWQPVPEAAQLDRDQREALDQLIKAIVRRGVTRVEQSITTNTKDAEVSSEDAALDALRDVHHGSNEPPVPDEEQPTG